MKKYTLEISTPAEFRLYRKSNYFSLLSSLLFWFLQDQSWVHEWYLLRVTLFPLSLSKSRGNFTVVDALIRPENRSWRILWPRLLIHKEATGHALFGNTQPC